MGTERYFSVPAGGTYLSNTVILDPDLSIEALGLLLVMRSMHPRASKSIKSLTGRGLGKERVRNALGELEQRGFRFRFEQRDAAGHIIGTLVVDSSEPIDVDHAFASIPLELQGSVGRCASHLGWRVPGPVEDENVSAGGTGIPKSVSRSLPGQTPAIHTTVDEPTQQVVDNLGEDETPVDKKAGADTDMDVSAGGTRIPVSGLRLPGVRSTGVRLPGSHKDKSLSKKDKSFNSGSNPGGLERVGDPADWALIEAALPPDLRTFFDVAAIGSVKQHLEAAVKAGWSVGQIQAQLAAKTRPPTVENPTGLLIHWLRTIAEAPAPGGRGMVAEIAVEGPPGRSPREIREEIARLFAMLRERDGKGKPVHPRAPIDRRLQNEFAALAEADPSVAEEAMGMLARLQNWDQMNYERAYARIVLAAPHRFKGVA